MRSLSGFLLIHFPNPTGGAPINKTLWLIPLLFLLHNAEESLGMTAYLKSQFHIAFISQTQFILAASILTVLVFLIICLYQIQVLSSIHWVIFTQGAIFFNAVQHLALFFYFGSYNPGAITAFFICLFSMILLAYVLKNKVVRVWSLCITLTGSLLSYPLIIRLTLILAGLFT
ncbi:HXXEE domain-containing protein [Peribacillus sp. NPDC097295]|uniref:HXXEE domain-containing protein n=1 Tax=Peribacillus sp. NPDC097295 TaxID=3364402 RepID=UPI00381C106E